MVPALRIFVSVVIFTAACSVRSGLAAEQGRVVSGEPEPSARSNPGYSPGPMLTRFLEGPMAGVEEIVFAVRVSGHDHWYVNFGYYSDNLAGSRPGFCKDEVWRGYCVSMHFPTLGIETRLQFLRGKSVRTIWE